MVSRAVSILRIFGAKAASYARLVKYLTNYSIVCQDVELEIPHDHIHMVVRGEPKTSPSKVMQIMKSISAREFFRRYPEIKHHYFWGGKLWTQSYFVETIGNADEETIRKYVQNQLAELDKHETKYSQLGLL